MMIWVCPKIGSQLFGALAREPGKPRENRRDLLPFRQTHGSILYGTAGGIPKGIMWHHFCRQETLMGLAVGCLVLSCAGPEVFQRLTDSLKRLGQGRS